MRIETPDMTVANIEKNLGIYIHIPFCVRKCKYCDFLSAPADNVIRHEYAVALCGEIRAAGNAWKAGESGDWARNKCGSGINVDSFAGCKEEEDGETGRKPAPVDTIFIGGGTPTTLKPADLAMIMECVHDNFRVLRDAEITMEMNPGTFSEGMLAFVRKYVNRVSIGLQSVRDDDLRVLGRIHTYQEFENCYKALRQAGITNINVDLMSAIPGQTVQGWEETLRKVVVLSPEHISAYSLIIEEGTPFFDMLERGELDLPDEEEEREMYHLTKEVLAAAGYHRYEISNYAKPGYECRHNMRYWRREPYLGFGIGAASMYDDAVTDSRTELFDVYRGECRRNNLTDLHTYIGRYGPHEKGTFRMNDFQDEGFQIHRLTKEEAMEEFMFLGLRMTDGVSEQRFFDAFDRRIDDVYGGVISKFQENGLLFRGDGRIALTERGLDVSNMVMAEFLL